METKSARENRVQLVHIATRQITNARKGRRGIMESSKGQYVKRGNSFRHNECGGQLMIDGLTWIAVNGKEIEIPAEGEDEKHGFVMPKCYHLFHRSQVEART